MSDIKISISPVKQKSEYNHAELEAVGAFVAEHPKIITSEKFESFINHVGENGHAFCPATYKNGVKTEETFDQLQLLVLSFSLNDGRELEALKEKTKKYNVQPSFIYDAFSPSPTRKKLVMGFRSDVPFQDVREAEAAYAALKTIFPEADKDCNPMKLYQGGNRVLYFDESLPEVNTYSLLMNMSLWLRDRYGADNYKRRQLREFAKKTDVALKENGFPNVTLVKKQTESSAEEKNVDINSSENSTINDKNMTFRIKENSNVTKLSTYSCEINFSTDTSEQVLPQQNYGSFRSKDLQNLGSSCKLYRAFLSGESQLSEKELLGLALSVTKIRGGAAKFKETLSSKENDRDSGSSLGNWDFYLTYVKDDTPWPCEAFCSFCDDCPHGKNILSTLKPQKHQIEKIANWGEALVSIEEAVEDFKRKFMQAVRSSRNIWYILKSQTALGKSQTVLELLRDYDFLRILIVVPTNRLKRELCERARKMGVSIVVSPSLHELFNELPDYARSTIEALYREGKSPMPYVKKLIEENDPECSKILQQYLEELQTFSSAEGHAISTHRRLASMDVSKYDLVIVDEDILYSTVIPSKETISISDLKKIKKELSAKDPLAIKIGNILKKRKASRYFSVKGIEYCDAYADIKVAANIPALCSAKYFCSRLSTDYEESLAEDSVTFVTPIKFQPNTKYIMLSATADRGICEYYFGDDNMQFFDCKEAALTGRLNLYGDKPTGRSSVRKDTGIYKRINNWTQADCTISFKEFLEHYDGYLYFGNCAGCDTEKGKNIDVVGTPHQPWWIYELVAFSLGFSVDEKPVPNLTAEYNGYRFPFYTYKDQTLRNIQFYMVASELEQAVGRARLLRFDCTVNLFSNFPVRQAEVCVSEYDK